MNHSRKSDYRQAPRHIVLHPNVNDIIPYWTADYISFVGDDTLNIACHIGIQFPTKNINEVPDLSRSLALTMFTILLDDVLIAPESAYLSHSSIALNFAEPENAPSVIRVWCPTPDPLAIAEIEIDQITYQCPMRGFMLSWYSS